jgi:malonyl-CoA O-methyltransferase
MTQQPPVILLHGWGFSSRIWRPLLTQLAEQHNTEAFAIDLPGFGSAYHEPLSEKGDDALEQTLQYILEQLPDRSVLCGWSLGGMLAVQIAARWPERVAGIITLGSNLHFTDTENWPGMPAQDYAEFCRRFAAQPEKTWQRFLTLQARGDENANAVSTLLTLLTNFADIHPQTASRLLTLLGTIDNRRAFARISAPGLHITGEHDAITPSAILPHLSRINPSQQSQWISGCGHALFLSQTATVAKQIADFLENIPYAVNKRRIALAFSRAASSYDNAAQLQRDIGEHLFSLLPEETGHHIIDMGCGTGFITKKLAQRSRKITAIDIAHGMLQTARQQLPAHVQLLQADMENLPLADACVDTLVSNLALQWSQHLAKAFMEWRRVLSPQGKMIFSTFLPGTLQELEQSWRAVDGHVHVNRFTDTDTLVSALRNAGFTTITCQPQRIVCHYDKVSNLVRELKAIGAHNMNAGQPNGLTGKSDWQRMEAQYETLRTQDGLPATYEVLYVVAH